VRGVSLLSLVPQITSGGGPKCHIGSEAQKKGWADDLFCYRRGREVVMALSRLYPGSERGLTGFSYARYDSSLSLRVAGSGGILMKQLLGMMACC